MHKLCISRGLEEHRVPVTPPPILWHSRMEQGGVHVCVCECSRLHGGVHRPPSVRLLQPPAGRHGTPCRRCSAPLPLSLKASRCMSHKHTPVSFGPICLLTHQSHACIQTHSFIIQMQEIVYVEPQKTGEGEKTESKYQAI